MKIANRYIINLYFFHLLLMKNKVNGKINFIIRLLSNKRADHLITFLSW